MATPSILYQTRATTDCRPAGMPLPKYLLPESCPESVRAAALAWEQEFEQRLDQWPPAPRNTPANAAAFVSASGNANAILTSLTTPSNSWAGNGKFRIGFAVVPAAWDDFQTQAVTFTGWLDINTSGRARGALSRTVKCRLHYDYFVLDPAGVLNGGTAPTTVQNGSVHDSGGTPVKIVPSLGTIPPILRSVWVNQGGSYPIPNSEAKDLSDGVTVGASYYLPTYPTVTNYQTMCATAAPYLAGTSIWTSAAPVVVAFTAGSSHTDNFSTAGQFVYADSSIKTYAGLIVERCSYFTLAQ